MLTLTYGFKKPEDGDKGVIFWDVLADDIQQLNDHTHNGVNSSKLASSSVESVTQAVSSASWVSAGGGTYYQNVTMPAGMEYDDHGIQVRLTAGDIIYPTITKIGTSVFRVYINDNTQDLLVVYV